MTDFATLNTDVADFLNREDLTASIPAFIRLAEAQFNRDLRVYQMENRATFSNGDRYFARPDDWLETIRLTIDGEYYELEPISTREMAQRRANNGDASGTPRFFRNSENGFEVFPTPDEAKPYILEYYQQITPIDASVNTTNWLLTTNYDIYLYGALTHAGVYLQDDTMLAKYTPLMAAGLQSLISASNKASNSGAGRRLHVRGLGGSRIPRR